MPRLRPALLSLAAAAAVYAVVSRAAKFVLRRPMRLAGSEIGPMHDDTRIDRDSAVRSVQSADGRMPTAAIDAIWTPMHLERLARTYWRFLSRCTLGLIRVEYTDDERLVVLVRRPLVLLRFSAPEYEMSAERGVVRWRIERGVLVAPEGRNGEGYLEIDVQRRPSPQPGTTAIHIEIEVANFYPQLAKPAMWLYAVTQSRIHVLVTYGFVRSLAQLDLAESKVGRFAQEHVDDPASPPPTERGSASEARRVAQP